MVEDAGGRALGNRVRLSGGRVLDDMEDCLLLLDWFDAQDPLPATDVNERLVEHVRRVVVAEEMYPSATNLSGYDDRGSIYVQYGEPRRRHSIRYDDLRFARDVFRFGVDVARSDFAQHEIWTYAVSGSEFTYIFIQDRDGYWLGTSLDLLPQRLRQGFNHTPRGQNYATAALAAMRWIYERLAVNHSGYGSIYREISAYDDRQEALRSINRLAPEREITEESVYNLDYQMSGLGHADRPSHFIQELVAKTSLQERELIHRRESQMPATMSDIEQANRLTIDPLRHARLLKSDGTTRAIVYWRDGLSRYDDADLDAAFGLLHRARLLANGPDRIVLVDTTYVASASREPVVRLDARISTTVQGAALQVDRHLGSGAWLGSGSSMLPSLEPLGVVAGQVEVSDLLPFKVDNLIAGQILLRENPRVEELPLFPERNLAGQEAIGAYFEVYVPGARGQEADIVISYEVVRKRRGGLLRRAQEESMLLPFRRVNVGERLPAAFFVDRAAWEGADEVELVVTITDVASGRDVVRTLHFEVGSG